MKPTLLYCVRGAVSRQDRVLTAEKLLAQVFNADERAQVRASCSRYHFRKAGFSNYNSPAVFSIFPKIFISFVGSSGVLFGR